METSTAESRRSRTWTDRVCGMALGVVVWWTVLSLFRELPLVPGNDLGLIAAAAVGALLYRGSLRKLMCAAASVSMVALAVVAFTPLARVLVSGLVLGESDPLQPAPAVVVLAAGVHANGDMNPDAQARILRGYEILHAGLAPTLVLTQGAPPWPSWIPTVRRQMAALGMQCPIVDAGRVGDTHDEAVAVARIARERGWTRIILVTHPTHMRRAAGVFRKAGLTVERAPCQELRYDIATIDHTEQRLWAFRQLVHETIGLWAYHRRGWL